MFMIIQKYFETYDDKTKEDVTANAEVDIDKPDVVSFELDVKVSM